MEEAIILAQPVVARRPICHNVMASNTVYYQLRTWEMACQNIWENRESSVLACVERVQ